MLHRVALLYLLFLLPFQVTAQQSGNPDHQKPPDGVTCAPVGHEPMVHACGCHRECEVTKDGAVTEHEDPACRWYCFRYACTCGPECAP